MRRRWTRRWRRPEAPPVLDSVRPRNASCGSFRRPKNVARTLRRLCRRLHRHHHGAGTDRHADHRVEHAPRRARRPRQRRRHAGRHRHHDRGRRHRAHHRHRGDGPLVRIAAAPGRGLPHLDGLADDPFERPHRARRSAGAPARRLLPAGLPRRHQQSEDADLLRRLLPAIHRSGRQLRAADHQ